MDIQLCNFQFFAFVVYILIVNVKEMHREKTSSHLHSESKQTNRQSSGGNQNEN